VVSVGYFSFSGDMDSALRLEHLSLNQDYIVLQAGAGIVADSKPEALKSWRLEIS